MKINSDYDKKFLKKLKTKSKKKQETKNHVTKCSHNKIKIVKRNVKQIK